ncbi:hypothetical protein JHK85_003471 [Glycine max]|nr:hypothetical protein JHK85_003471 [Glycine max]
MFSEQYAGKMTNNIGNHLIHYKVIDPSNDPINSKHYTLRYEASKIQGEVYNQVRDVCVFLLNGFTLPPEKELVVYIQSLASSFVFCGAALRFANVDVAKAKSPAPVGRCS